ncbi:MAG: V4R domain-containing protein [Anaerolineales bacterium]
MISIDKSHKTYPNHPTRAFLLALVDILGKNGVNAVLRIASLQEWIETYPAENFEREVDLSEFSSLNAALEEVYGSRGGHGLARRASKYTFDLTWKQHGPLGDLQTTAFDSLPAQTKNKEGLALFAEVLSASSDLECEVQEEDHLILFRVKNCPVCWGRESSSPACQGFVGLLEGCLQWLGSGINFEITEKECSATGGDACTFSIHKEPVE